MILMKIEGLVAGMPTPFDGQYLKEYDPSRDGTDGQGHTLMAHIVTTPDKDEAMKFNDLSELHRTWTMVDSREPTRPYDGKPNRPLTAFSISTENL